LTGIFEQQSLDALSKERPAWTDLNATLSVQEAAGLVPDCLEEFNSIFIETVDVVISAADAFLEGEAANDESLGVDALNNLEQAEAMILLLREMLP